MRIASLRVRNYKTLEDINLTFSGPYSAICGPNDSGKTNVVRAIRALMKTEFAFKLVSLGMDEDLSVKNDFPKWIECDAEEREIRFELNLVVDSDRDLGFHSFVTKQLGISTEEPWSQISLAVTYSGNKPDPSIQAEVLGKNYAGLEAQEVLKRLRSSRSILFHNSTEIDARSPFSTEFAGYIRAMTDEERKIVDSMKQTVDKGLKRLSKKHKEQLESLLGRLDADYRVGLTMPPLDFSSVPYRLTLGQKDFEVTLDDWGSGTKNRTLILLTLFRAKQISESAASVDKITPIMIVEEPESFLHPSAQAEFGRILNDLAREFDVQVIVTTHSPYLLNMNEPSANILLQRKTHYNRQQGTERINTASDDWAKPFALALGLETEQLSPWKNLIIRSSKYPLLVEGEHDKEYFSLLRNPEHGSDRLEFDGDIESNEGTGSLQNTVLLRLLKTRNERIFVTYDLDAEHEVEKHLKAVGLEKGKHYLPIGQNIAGKKSIEGLLPEKVLATVYGTHAALVQTATSGADKEEQKKAKAALKKLLLAEFKRSAKPGEDYRLFHSTARGIGKALRSW
nr:AAA family ATPase [Nitrosomonas nitrosa]